jgi:sulfite exporter TauE/SafE
MIGTIGSLVQETYNRARWLAAVSLYATGCVITATLLGAALGGLGHLVFGERAVSASSAGATQAWLWAISALAVVYALSDVGVLWLPRPYIMPAVPAEWWRRWRPYGAALAYGSALGIGVTTRIPFGAFYVICGWCVVNGSMLYGATLLGVYGLARGLVMLPVGWVLGRRRIDIMDLLASPILSQSRAQVLVAAVTMVFGVELAWTASLLAFR